jgi:putative membrane protein
MRKELCTPGNDFLSVALVAQAYDFYVVASCMDSAAEAVRRVKMNRTQRTLAIMTSVLIVIVVLGRMTMTSMVGYGSLMGPGMMWRFGPHATSWIPNWMMVVGMGLGWLSMLAFWGALILGVVLLAQWLNGTKNRATNQPLDLLQRRYAAGEITREQYEQMLANLQRSPPAPEPRG